MTPTSKLMKITLNVYNRNGTLNKIISLKFPIPTITDEKNSTIYNPLDITDRYHEFTAREYNELFDKLFIPTIKNETFMISKQDYDNGVYTIPCWTKMNAKNKQQFIYDNYKYTYDPLFNIFTVKYTGAKDIDELKSYPLPSFNGIGISYKGLYKGCAIKSFDMSKLTLDCCIDISEMFMNCINLCEVNNFAIKYHRIHNMKNMFNGCIMLTKLDMSNSVYIGLSAIDIELCFAYCQSLKELNISNILIKNTFSKYNSMFLGCKSLVKLTCQPYVWAKVKNLVPCSDYWIPATLKTLKPLMVVDINDNNNNIATTYINTYNDTITVVNIGDNAYKVLWYDTIRGDNEE